MLRRHRLTGPGLALLMVVACFAAGCSAPTTAPDSTGFHPWPAGVDWQRYVEGPARGDVHPVAVARVSGPVTGAGQLAHPTPGGAVTLTMAQGGPRPAIVLDYGKDVGGVPYFVVRSTSGAPVLRVAYSEGLPYLGPDGDNGPSQSDAGDTSRADSLTARSPGTLSTGLIQGGERYESIMLTSPGTLSLSSVGIRFDAVRATSDDYRGWFDSSSDQLNRIWYDGAYTTQLDELPAGTLPAAWHIRAGSLDADGGIVGVLAKGTDWTDYRVSFQTRIVDGATGWVVRAPSPSSGYLFIVDGAGDTTGGSDTLRMIAFGPAEFDVIADVPLPLRVPPGSWHQVTTTVSGTSITTSIDGHQGRRLRHRAPAGRGIVLRQGNRRVRGVPGQ